MSKEVDEMALKSVQWAGGVANLAVIIGCSHTTISLWLNKRKPLAAEWALLIQKHSKGKIKAKDIRPELF